MKKIWVICIVVFSLTTCLSGTTAAAGKTIFTDYSKEDEHDDYGPKVGFDWIISDKWGIAINYQFDGTGDREALIYSEVRYKFLEPQLTLFLANENSESLDNSGIKLGTFRSVKESLWFDGYISYNAYLTKRERADDPDYQLWKLFVGFQYQLNGKMLSLFNAELTDTSYNKEQLMAVNPDYIEERLSFGLLYQANQAWQLGGTYTSIYTDCEDQAVDAIWGGSVDKFVITTKYNYKQYNYYLEYPFPQRGNIAKIGVSYSF